jgi:aspartyl/asparaginyl-tRNA synthetase
MTDDDLIRRGDALYAIAGWDIPSTAIAALPAVEVQNEAYAERDLMIRANGLLEREIEKLTALLKEARQDLEVYITNEYPKDQHPYYERQWNRDMELCRRIDAALEEVKDDPAA